MRSLPIVWQRLVTSGGRTCDRCDTTHEELLRAVRKLATVLRPVDIRPALEIRELDEATFRADPSLSNRIWIAGRPLEEWLGARAGASPCCSVCGESPCRTVERGGTVFETIPEALFLEAAIVAAATLVAPASGRQPRDAPPPRSHG